MAVRTRVHLAKQPISSTYGAIQESEVETGLQFFFACVLEMLAHNYHMILEFDDVILYKIFEQMLNFCPNQGTYTLPHNYPRDQALTQSQFQETPWPPQVLTGLSSQTNCSTKSTTGVIVHWLCYGQHKTKTNSIPGT